MNEMKIFNSEEFGKVRTVVINDEPWFVGKDVAEALGYTNTRKAISDHVHEDDKGVTKWDTLGAVSYTHLDVYKRQDLCSSDSI